MSGRGQEVPRPRRRSEYVIVFGTNEAKKSWADLNATARNALVEAWESLTAHPHEQSITCHPLKGELASVVRDGVRHDQWQLELPGGARLWYYVVPSKDRKSAGTVVLVRVATRHPNETK